MVDAPLPVGSRVRVRLALVFDLDTFSEPLELDARIVWCTAVANAFQLGTAFLDMNADSRIYLDMFLRYLEDGASKPTTESDHAGDDDRLA